MLRIGLVEKSMKNVELKEVSYENLKDVEKIYDTLSDQDKRHVAPNIVSLAEAYLNYNIAWPRAIVVDNEVIGFLMLGLDNYIADPNDYPVYFLWRFMIGSKFQNKGYGKQALNQVIEKCRNENIKFLYVSCTKLDAMPYDFYIRYGFEDTQKVDDKEQVLKLKL